MPIPFKLDYVIDRTRASQSNREQRILKVVAGVNLTPAEAHTLWPRLLEHKWFMSEKLGRDVGLRVAAIDFFENGSRLAT